MGLFIIVGFIHGWMKGWAPIIGCACIGPAVELISYSPPWTYWAELSHREFKLTYWLLWSIKRAANALFCCICWLCICYCWNYCSIAFWFIMFSNWLCIAAMFSCWAADWIITLPSALYCAWASPMIIWSVIWVKAFWFIPCTWSPGAQAPPVIILLNIPFCCGLKFTLKNILKNIKFLIKELKKRFVVSNHGAIEFS